MRQGFKSFLNLCEKILFLIQYLRLYYSSFFLTFARSVDGGDTILALGGATAHWCVLASTLSPTRPELKTQTQLIEICKDAFRTAEIYQHEHATRPLVYTARHCKVTFTRVLFFSHPISSSLFVVKYSNSTLKIIH
jgi:hypothetical protein